MAWQRPIGVKATPLEHDSNNSTIEELQEWRTIDCSIGYLQGEAILGGVLTVAVGLTNLTDLRLALHFTTAQRVRLVVKDAHGNTVYETPEETTPLPSDEVLSSTEGRYWTEPILLDPTKFQVGQPYVVIGFLISTNLPASAAVPFSVAALDITKAKKG